MAGCDCRKTSRRDFNLVNPGPPPAVVTIAGVMIESDCVVIPRPGGGDDDGGGRGDWDAAHYEAGYGSERYAPPPKKKKGKKEGEEPAVETICLNRLTVSLLAGSTAGLQVVELDTGLDKLPLAVGVGASQQLLLGGSACENATASVRIVDGAGNQVAVLGGFAICRVVP